MLSSEAPDSTLSFQLADHGNTLCSNSKRKTPSLKPLLFIFPLFQQLWFESLERETK